MLMYWVFSRKRKYPSCIYLSILLLYLYVSTVWRGVWIGIDTCGLDYWYTVCVRHRVRRFGLARLFFSLEILHEYALNTGANDHRRLCWSQNGSESIAASKELDSSTVRILTGITHNIIDILHICSIFESKPLSPLLTSPEHHHTRGPGPDPALGMNEIQVQALRCRPFIESNIPSVQRDPRPVTAAASPCPPVTRTGCRVGLNIDETIVATDWTRTGNSKMNTKLCRRSAYEGIHACVGFSGQLEGFLFSFHLSGPLAI